MLSWALTFFILAIIAGIFGFTGVAAASAGIAKILFVIFVLLFIASFFFKAADKADRFVDKNL